MLYNFGTPLTQARTRLTCTHTHAHARTLAYTHVYTHARTEARTATPSARSVLVPTQNGMQQI